MNTSEQIKIMNWLSDNELVDQILRVQPLTKNSARITYRDYSSALVICRQDRTISLLEDVEAC